MFAEIDLLGAFVPAIAAWFVGALTIFVVVDLLLTRMFFLGCSGTRRSLALACSRVCFASAD